VILDSTKRHNLETPSWPVRKPHQIRWAATRSRLSWTAVGQNRISGYGSILWYPSPHSRTFEPMGQFSEKVICKSRCNDSREESGLQQLCCLTTSVYMHRLSLFLASTSSIIIRRNCHG
jgi:hypothetical protein